MWVGTDMSRNTALVHSELPQEHGHKAFSVVSHSSVMFTAEHVVAITAGTMIWL